MPDHKPILNLGVADNRLDQAGFVKRWYPSSEEGVQSTNICRWPGVKCVTLAPVYEPGPDEAALAQWTTAGTDSSYTSCSGLWGSSGATHIIKQTVPSATACTVTSTFTAAANQPFFVDFYLYAVYDKTWYADLKFGRRWCLRLLYNGSMQVWTNMAAAGETDNWQYVRSLRALEDVRNKHLRLWVYPTAHQELIIWPQGQEPLTLLEAEPLVSLGADGYTYRSVCEAAAVVLAVSGGAFCFSYRYMRFETSGDITLPVQSLPWDYAGAWTLTGSIMRNREGYNPTATGELRDEAGTALTSPPAAAFRNFVVHIDLTTDNAVFTPELNWAQLLIDPTSKVHTPTYSASITGGGQLVSIGTGAELRGRREARMALSNLDGTFSSLWNHLRMCATITDETGLIAWWKGYTERTAWPLEQDGNNRIELGTTDMLSRLDIPLTDAYIGDGTVHTDFVEQLFKRAGLAATDYSIAVDPDSMTLPEALGEEEPLFQARDGKTIREMVEYICKVWSGWELYADSAGVVHYAPLTVGSPTITLQGYETAVAGELKYFSCVTTRDESAFYNVIVVVGMDPAENPILAYYYNSDSVGDPTAADYLGMEKLLVVADSNLRTDADVQAALDYIVAEHGTPLVEADVECDWHDTLDVGAVVTFGDVGGSWQVQSLDRIWEPDARLRLRLKQVA